MLIPWLPILAIGSIGALIFQIYRGWHLPRQDRKKKRIINFYKPFRQILDSWINEVENFKSLHLPEWRELERKEVTNVKHVEKFEERINRYQNQLKTTRKFIEQSMWYKIFRQTRNYVKNKEEIDEVERLTDELRNILMQSILRGDNITHSLLRDKVTNEKYERITDRTSVQINKIFQNIDKIRDEPILKSMRKERLDFLKYLKKAKEDINNQIGT